MVVESFAKAQFEKNIITVGESKENKTTTTAGSASFSNSCPTMVMVANGRIPLKMINLMYCRASSKCRWRGNTPHTFLYRADLHSVHSFDE